MTIYISFMFYIFKIISPYLPPMFEDEQSIAYVCLYNLPLYIGFIRFATLYCCKAELQLLWIRVVMDAIKLKMESKKANYVGEVSNQKRHGKYITFSFREYLRLSLTVLVIILQSMPNIHWIIN